jgi:transglutaminase-like putative cysteine protease
MSPALNRRQFDRVTLAFVACVAAHALWLPPLLTAAVALVVGLRRWLITVHLKAWPTWIRLPLLIALLLIIRNEFGGLGRNGSTGLLIGLLALKLAESERRRDGLLVVCITLFLISIRFLFGESLTLTLYMIVPTLLCFWALSELHTQSSGALFEREQLRRLAWSALKTVALALPLALALWLLVPRLAQPLWGKPDVAEDARTGLGEEMTPGKMTELLVDDNVAMRVRFENEPPPANQLYWRGPVLWRFDGETWSGLSSWLRTERLAQAARPPSTVNQSYEVMLEPTDRPWLILLDVPVRTNETHHLTLDLQVLRPSTIGSLLRYRGESMVGVAAPASAFPGTEREWGLRLPTGYNPRAQALARVWADAASGDPVAIVERALAHFRNQPFSYSLSTPELGRDSIDDFLFETQIGYCEHYSSAFTFLMRAAGVPARVVTGYHGGYLNPLDQHMIVRNADAHAWSEVLIEGQGWVRVDPTAAVAPERIDRTGLATDLGGGWNRADWGQRLLMTFDAVGTWWNRSMLAFDARAQLALLERLGLDGRWEQRALLLIGSLLGFALLIALVMWKPWERERLAPLLRLQRRFEKLVAPWIGERPISMGAQSYADLARELLPDCRKQIDRYTNAFMASRYDPQAANAQLQSELQAALTDLKRELGGKAKPRMLKNA